MMKLPLKARVAIRDKWEDQSAPAQQSISNLTNTLGKSLVCEPEFEALLADLDSIYEDKEQFVSAVTSCITVWCQALAEILENEQHEGWADKLLDQLNERGQRALKLTVLVGNGDSPSTTWSATHAGFDLHLGSSALVVAQNYFDTFTGQLLKSFEEEKKSNTTVGDDWADVGADASVSAALPTRNASAGTGLSVIPNPKDIPRPDMLLSQPPYHIIVSTSGKDVQIQSSHSPSLNFIASYLRKWCRTDVSSTARPPLVGIELHKSPFSLGEVHDGLVLRHVHRGDNFPVSPTLVINLVMNVLGYTLVHTDTFYWEFRKDSPLRAI